MKQFFAAVLATLLSWGPLGALVLAVVDSAGLPVPEGVDALLVLMSANDPRAGYLGAVLAIAGSLVGSLFLFYLGRKGGEEFLDRRTQRPWQKRFRRWFHHYGGLTVFIPTLIPAPLPLKIFVLSAGALGMNRVHFVLIVLAARIPRYLGLAYLGAQMGTRPFEYLKHHGLFLLGCSFALFAVLYGIIKMMDRARERRHPAASATIE